VVECEVVGNGDLVLEESKETIAMTLVRELKSDGVFAVRSGVVESGQSLSSPLGGGTAVFSGGDRPGDYWQEDLMAAYWGLTGEHPDHPELDWMEAVASSETRDGYWRWVSQQLKNAQRDLSDPEDE